MKNNFFFFSTLYLNLNFLITNSAFLCFIFRSCSTRNSIFRILLNFFSHLSYIYVKNAIEFFIV